MQRLGEADAGFDDGTGAHGLGSSTALDCGKEAVCDWVVADA